MNSAWPVVLSTTLAGTGQGLVVALVAAELARPAPAAFQLAGSALALAFLAAGLAASLFCLGRPERASRAAARSRASWRSREAIVRPIFAAAVALWASAHALGFARAETLAIGAAALALDATLFLCTGMNCAGLAFVRERASYLAPLNFALLGTASGFSLSVPLAVLAHPPFAGPLALAAFWLAALAWLARGAAVLRDARLRPAASDASAIGAAHPTLARISQGITGESFNTREFFDRRPARVLAAARAMFFLLFFPLPGSLLGWGGGTLGAYVAAFLVQFAALIAERWLFFAEAAHPRNLRSGDGLNAQPR